MSKQSHEEIDYLMQELKELMFPKEYWDALKHLKTPTEKNVYQFLMYTGASSYTNIRRALGVSHHGLSDSLKRMKEAGVIYRMEDTRYELTARKEASDIYDEVAEWLKDWNPKVSPAIVEKALDKAHNEYIFLSSLRSIILGDGTIWEDSKEYFLREYVTKKIPHDMYVYMKKKKREAV